MKAKSRGELGEKEVHPEATGALRFILALGLAKLAMYQEAFSSCAIEGNRLGEICGETLHRLQTGQKVSDRYCMGLALALRRMEDNEGARILGQKKRKSAVSKVKVKRK